MRPLHPLNTTLSKLTFIEAEIYVMIRSRHVITTSRGQPCQRMSRLAGVVPEWCVMPSAVNCFSTVVDSVDVLSSMAPSVVAPFVAPWLAASTLAASDGCEEGRVGAAACAGAGFPHKPPMLSCGGDQQLRRPLIYPQGIRGADLFSSVNITGLSKAVLTQQRDWPRWLKNSPAPAAGHMLCDQVTVRLARIENCACCHAPCPRASDRKSRQSHEITGAMKC